ncbi:MAG: hypothetical protein LOD94_07700 [Gammaproteobacteria bacterium]
MTQNISNKPTQLPEELGMYVDALRQRHSAIDEVWVLASKESESAKRGGKWNLLAFADSSTLTALEADESVHRDDVNLIVVTDGDRFENAWGSRSRGRLSDIDWRREDMHTASYIAAASKRECAVRVR